MVQQEPQKTFLSLLPVVGHCSCIPLSLQSLTLDTVVFKAVQGHLHMQERATHVWVDANQTTTPQTEGCLTLKSQLLHRDDNVEQAIGSKLDQVSCMHCLVIAACDVCTETSKPFFIWCRVRTVARYLLVLHPATGRLNCSR